MSGKNTFKIFPQRNKRNHLIPGPSSQPLHPSTSSESRVPRINITSYDPHGLPTESYTEPTTTNQVAPSNDSDPKKSESFVDRMFKKIHRKLSLNRSGSSTSNLVEPSLHSQPSNDETALPPAPLILEGNINNSRERSETYSTRDNGLSVLAQLERGGINVPPLLEPTIMPSASSGSDRKKVVIGAMRLVLQNAALTLKFAPVPNLDAIPNLLLTWLQVYETVGGNDEGLKGLDDEIRGAYTTILRLLQLWTDQIPLM
ncbi:uncharacterized protein EI90DRAFT_3017482 [Cantharellus anzutake]|uniref:uncharacterized protein n=1 Tax=Cantharellus anzutake TaxID=1750568 RepID=UPI0019047822|nr:uncharacterized protein EI90DRAFT_3017482 [Cantharellus anzutake]KAF8328873.1 hypothetical protein EI90DRAFT_3017482 [Cantharellus anzutake]